MIAPVLAILLIAALVVIGPGTGDGRKNLFTSRIRDTIARNFQSAYADADAQHVYRRDVLDTNNTTPFLYTILPAESKNKTLTDAFQNKLFTLIPQNSTYTSQHNATGVLFWAANLTDSQISQLTTYNVSFVRDEPETYQPYSVGQGGPKKRYDTGEFHGFTDRPEKRRLVTDEELVAMNMTHFIGGLPSSNLTKRVIQQLISQNAVPDDMKVASQKPGISVLDMTCYTYEETSGRGITLYNIDSGFNEGISLNEFPNDDTYHWMFGYPARDRRRRDFNGHGTRMISKINGHFFGISKNLNIVICKLPGLAIRLWWAATLDLLGQIADDIDANLLHGKAVVNMPFKLPWINDEFMIRRMQNVLNYLTASDVVVVMSAGTDGPDVTSYPSLLAADNPGIVVVGCVDNYGNLDPDSQAAPFIRINAPCVEIMTVGGDGHLSWNSGTSLAASSVASMLGSLLSSDPKYAALIETDRTAETVINDLIEEYSYPRVPMGVNVYYNNVFGGCSQATSWLSLDDDDEGDEGSPRCALPNTGAQTTTGRGTSTAATTTQVSTNVMSMSVPSYTPKLLPKSPLKKKKTVRWGPCYTSLI